MNKKKKKAWKVEGQVNTDKLCLPLQIPWYQSEEYAGNALATYLGLAVFLVRNRVLRWSKYGMRTFTKQMNLLETCSSTSQQPKKKKKKKKI